MHISDTKRTIARFSVSVLMLAACVFLAIHLHTMIEQRLAHQKKELKMLHAEDLAIRNTMRFQMELHKAEMDSIFHTKIKLKISRNNFVRYMG